VFAERVIALLNPPPTAVVIVDVPWFPCATLREEGEAETVKVPDALAVCATNNMPSRQKERDKVAPKVRTRLLMKTP
jgi:hypothetical protein